MKICLLPLKTDVGNPDANMQRIERVLPRLLSKSPDLICLPECTLTGYLFQERELNKFGEPIPGPSTTKLAAITKQNDVQLSFGLIEKTMKGFYNSAVFINTSGEIVIKHRKLNEEPPYLPGDSFSSFPIKGKKCGLILCGDLFHPAIKDWINGAISFLIIPMSRSFSETSPDIERWKNEERQIYADRVRELGIQALFVNALETSSESASFGGAFVVNSDGKILSESPHGTDQPLFWKLV